MLVYIENSNLLDVQTGIVCHGCNAQGVFGAGVAKQVAQKYPKSRLSYLNHIEEMHRRDLDALGTVDFYPVSKELLIANMVTQQFYGTQGKVYVDYAAIYATMQRVIDVSKKLNLSIHIPHMIGCGLGGGDLNTITKIYNDFKEPIFCHKI